MLQVCGFFLQIHEHHVVMNFGVCSKCWPPCFIYVVIFLRICCIHILFCQSMFQKFSFLSFALTRHIFQFMPRFVVKIGWSGSHIQVRSNIGRASGQTMVSLARGATRERGVKCRTIQILERHLVFSTNIKYPEGLIQCILVVQPMRTNIPNCSYIQQYTTSSN